MGSRTKIAPRVPWDADLDRFLAEAERACQGVPFLTRSRVRWWKRRKNRLVWHLRVDLWMPAINGSEAHCTVMLDALWLRGNMERVASLLRRHAEIARGNHGYWGHT